MTIRDQVRDGAASVARSSRDRRGGVPLCAADRLPYPRRRRRHVDVIDAERLERVDERVDYRRRRADGAGFADTLDPERVGLARHLFKISVDTWHRVGARHAVIHEATGEELPGLAVVDLVLDQRLADALYDAALDLSADDHRIEHAAEVIDHEIAIEGDLAGLGIDLQLADVRAVGMAGRACAVAAGRLEPHAEFLGQRPHRRIGRLGDIRDGDRAVGADDTVFPVLELDVGGIRLHQRGSHRLALLDDRLGGFEQGIAADGRASGAVGAAPDRHLGGVALHVTDGFERHAEAVVNKLREYGGVALTVRMRAGHDVERPVGVEADRKSTRLNSSHLGIAY